MIKCRRTSVFFFPLLWLRDRESHSKLVQAIKFARENETLLESSELINFERVEISLPTRYREDRDLRMKALNESKLRNDCNSYSAIGYEQKVTAQCVCLTRIHYILYAYICNR